MSRRPFRDYAPVQRFQPSLAISPDGATVVYCSNASGQSNLWRQDIGSDHASQLTRYTEHSVREVAWSPDGMKLAFVADHHGDEFGQVYVIDAAGGEPRALTNAPQVQHHLAIIDPFSRDGRFLLYDANDRDRTCQDVLVYDLQTDEIHRVVEQEGLHHGIAFSPDAARIAAVRENSNTDAELFLVDFDSAHPAGAPAPVSPHEGQAKHEPGPWTADGTALYALTDQEREFVGIATFGPQAGGPDWVERPKWDVEQIVRSNDANVLAWTVNEDGYSRLQVRDLAKGIDLDVPDLPGGMMSALQISDDGTRVAFLLSAAGQPVEVYAVDLARGDVHVLTHSVPPALVENPLAEPTLIRYPTHDGREVAAFLYRPHGDGPFPVVLSIHGGPEAQERPVYMYGGLYAYLLANGVGVLAPNVRGSTGYGKTFQKLIHHDWAATNSATSIAPSTTCTHCRGSIPLASVCSAGRSVASPRCPAFRGYPIVGPRRSTSSAQPISSRSSTACRQRGGG